jgi:hypothetical protein
MMLGLGLKLGLLEIHFEQPPEPLDALKNESQASVKRRDHRPDRSPSPSRRNSDLAAPSLHTQFKPPYHRRRSSRMPTIEAPKQQEPMEAVSRQESGSGKIIAQQPVFSTPCLITVTGPRLTGDINRSANHAHSSKMICRCEAVP